MKTLNNFNLYYKKNYLFLIFLRIKSSHRHKNLPTVICLFSKLYSALTKCLPHRKYPKNSWLFNGKYIILFSLDKLSKKINLGYLIGAEIHHLLVDLKVSGFFHSPLFFSGAYDF